MLLPEASAGAGVLLPEASPGAGVLLPELPAGAGMLLPDVSAGAGVLLPELWSLVDDAGSSTRTSSSSTMTADGDEVDGWFAMPLPEVSGACALAWVLLQAARLNKKATVMSRFISVLLLERSRFHAARNDIKRAVNGLV